MTLSKHSIDSVACIISGKPAAVFATRLFLGLALALLWVLPLAAGPLEDGSTAYVKGDFPKALSLLQPLADQGNAQAQYQIGVMHRFGQGVMMNDAEATKWYRKAADQGHAKAQYNLGRNYFKGRGIAKDDAEAMKWFRKAAEQGHAPSQAAFGEGLLNGVGGPKNEAEAVKWIRKAADQGHTSALNRLGDLYFKGVGVKQSDAEALKLARRSADLGDEDALFNLGLMYSRGLGVKQDHVEAYKWFSLSSKRHSKGPDRDKSNAAALDVAEKLTIAELEEAKKRAREWTPGKK